MNWTLIVAVCTFFAALGGIFVTIAYHGSDVAERESERRRALRDAIIQAALLLDDKCRTSRILATQCLNRSGESLSAKTRCELAGAIPRLREVEQLAERMREAYATEDPELSFQDLEQDLRHIREARLESVTVLRMVESVYE